jgi:linoleate 9S-lipoxygenase
MFQNIIDAITGCCTGDCKKKIRGTVVLMKKNVLDLTDLNASIHDRVHEFLGQGVSLQLVSAVNSDPSGTYTICSSSIILLLFHYLMPFQP